MKQLTAFIFELNPELNSENLSEFQKDLNKCLILYIIMETPIDCPLTALMNKKAELLKLAEDAKIKNNFEDYLKYKKELNNLYFKTYHLKNKDKEEYKQKKINNYKKYLESPENYERHKSKQKEYYKRLISI